MNDSNALLAPSTSEPLDIAAIEAEHAQWLNSGGKEGRRANLRGADLTGADLSNHHFSQASLRGATLIGAKLNGADLRSADLSEAILNNANLQGALLGAASLTRAQMQNVNATGADLTGADCSGATAEAIILQGATMDNAVWRDANLQRANFNRASLRSANLRGAVMVSASLKEADLNSSDCREIRFDNADFASARLEQANFRGVSLKGVNLEVADFSATVDLPTEYKGEILQSQRRAQEEREQFLSKRNEVIALEQQLLKEKRRTMEICTELTEQQKEWARVLMPASGKLVICFALWLIIGSAILILTTLAAIEVSGQLKVERLIVVLSAVFFILSLSATSVVYTMRVSRVVKKAIAFCLARRNELELPEEDAPTQGIEHQMEPSLSHSDAMESPSSEPFSESSYVSARAEGHFGKKR